MNPYKCFIGVRCGVERKGKSDVQKMSAITLEQVQQLLQQLRQEEKEWRRQQDQEEKEWRRQQRQEEEEWRRQERQQDKQERQEELQLLFQQQRKERLQRESIVAELAEQASVTKTSELKSNVKEVTNRVDQADERLEHKVNLKNWKKSMGRVQILSGQSVDTIMNCLWLIRAT